MKTLILDTSSRYLVVAIYEDGKCLDAIIEEGSKRQSENAIPYIEKLMDAHQLELFDFDEMVVTRGPGSYTGVRVGLTIVKTVKTVHETTAVKMISSLAMYAGNKGKKISVIDARSKKIFVACYEDGKEVLPETMIDVESFAAFRQSYPDFEVVGEVDVLNLEMNTDNLAENLYALSLNVKAVESVHELLPRYIKDVEAKKIWHP